jgi:two-component system sensor histidine kinase UhpB
MPLRYRLILPIALMLLVSLTLGGALAWLHAMRSVATEMDAALAVGRHTVLTVLPYIDKGDDRAADLGRLIDTFSGDRHLRATLIGGDGKVLAASSLFAAPRPVPHWFGRALGGNTPSARLVLSPGQGASTILLETDAGNELTEVWTEFGDDIQILVVFSLLTFPMIYWILGRALRPLDRISSAFGDIGPGVAIQPITEAGPPELARLARGFNAMVDRLTLAETRNRRLNEQLSTIQEEERAEMARDLHDEIGPYLFAMSVDAAGIQKAAESRGQADIVAQIQSVRAAVTHVQHQVKDILVRLRAGNLTEFGLKQALENLASFWRSRHGDVAITVTMDSDGTGFGEIFEGTIYRIVQESLNNAMRHGKPSHVAVKVATVADRQVVVEVSDDGGGLTRSAGARGLGLRGMAERVTSLGGHLEIRNRAEGTGVIVTALLPNPDEERTIAA